MLVEGAADLSPDETHTVVRQWMSLADDTLEPGEAGTETRWCHASRTLANALKIDALLVGDAADAVEARLDALMAPVPNDARTAAERRADALASMAGADHVHAHVDVIVDVDTLTRRRGTDVRGARCEIPTVGPIAVESARRHACDGHVGRVVMNGRREVLDVGRRTRVVSAAMRRAVIARDQHCVFPGCTRPWTQIHHLVHWADGGETTVANLAAVCGNHHRFVHEGRWKLVRLDDGSYDAVPP